MGTELADEATHDASWRAFRTYWVGVSCSQVGDHFSILAVPFTALLLSHSDLQVGLLLFAGTAAQILSAVLFGTTAERSASVRTIVRADTVMAACVGLLAVLDWFDALNLPALYVATIALGTTRSFTDGARAAIVTDLIPRHRDLHANNRLVFSENLGFAIGPILAGLALYVSPGIAFGIDALTFAVSGVALAMATRQLPRQLGANAETASGDWPTEQRAGWDALRSHSFYGRTLLLAAGFNVASLPLGEQIVSLTHQTLGYDARQIGILMALSGLAGIVSSPLIERDDTIRPVALAIAPFAIGVTVALAGWWPNTATVLIAIVTAGFAFTWFMTNWLAIRQNTFPLEVQARVSMICRALVMTSVAIGAPLGGWLADLMSPGAMWVACGTLGAAAAVLLGPPMRNAQVAAANSDSTDDRSKG